jgi:UDP-N-acetyl-D-mannosaminuronate dehydrogenase
MLIEDAPEDFGQLIRLERNVTDNMAKHAVSLLKQTLEAKGKPIQGARVAILRVTRS